MKVITLSIKIHSPREAVWEAVTSNKYYNDWTKVFTTTSYFEGSWEEGKTIRFLAKNKKGSTEGMVSQIAESRYPEYISIKHLGYIYDGVDDTTSDDIKSWAPAFENYTFENSENNTTHFNVEVEVTDEYYELFLKQWPKALEALKETAELINKSNLTKE